MRVRVRVCVSCLTHELRACPLGVVINKEGADMSLGSQPSGQPTPPPQMMHASSSSTGASTGGGVTSPDQVSGGSSAVPTPGPGGQPLARRMSTSSRMESKEEPIGFDEGILRGLCDMDVSVSHITKINAHQLTLSVHCPFSQTE